MLVERNELDDGGGLSPNYKHVNVLILVVR